MGDDFKVDKGIPLPTTTRGRSLKYRWCDLEIGDSVMFKANKATAVGRNKINTIRSSSLRYGKSHKMKFRAALVVGGIRVWRLS